MNNKKRLVIERKDWKSFIDFIHVDRSNYKKLLKRIAEEERLQLSSENDSNASSSESVNGDLGIDDFNDDSFVPEQSLNSDSEED